MVISKKKVWTSYSGSGAKFKKTQGVGLVAYLVISKGDKVYINQRKRQIIQKPLIEESGGIRKRQWGTSYRGAKNKRNV